MNTISQDIQYVGMVRGYLDRFKCSNGKKHIYNFRCPYCGDSEKDKSKTRGYLCPSKDKTCLLFFCHNCNKGASMRNFLKQLSDQLYNEYNMDLFKESRKGRVRIVDTQNKIKSKVKRTEVPNKETIKSKYLTRVSDLDDNHHCIVYLNSRKIPKTFYSSLYYTQEFKAFTNEYSPHTFETTAYDEPRLIIPYYDKDGKVLGYQGRSFKASEKRYKYITIKGEDENDMVWGMDNVDTNKIVFLVEGPLDAMCLPNSLACAGARLNSIKTEFDIIYIFDNDKRNASITSLVSTAIDDGKKVFIWTNNIPTGYDINDLVVKLNMTGEAIATMIKKHSHTGLLAKLKFSNWKK